MLLSPAILTRCVVVHTAGYLMEPIPSESMSVFNVHVILAYLFSVLAHEKMKSLVLNCKSFLILAKSNIIRLWLKIISFHLLPQQQKKEQCVLPLWQIVFGCLSIRPFFSLVWGLDRGFASPAGRQPAVYPSTAECSRVCVGLSVLITFLLFVCVCACVYLCFFQGICEGERACGEEARILEASPTTANRERVNWVPGVDLQSRSETQLYLYTAGVNLAMTDFYC